MSNDRLAVDPVRLQQANKDFHDLYDRVSDASQKLDTAIAAVGNCWGSDKVGKSFESNYLQTSKDVPGSLSDFAKTMASRASDIEEMAARYAKADAEASDAVDRLLK